MSQPFLKIKDFTKAFSDSLKTLKDEETLVGIPQTENTRKEQEEGEPNNATLLFINNFGSEDAHIPPRPVMEIGIRDAREKIAEEYKRAAQAVLGNPVAAMDVYHNRVGIIGSNSVKMAINNQIEIKPLADSTLRGRLAMGFKGTKALIVTGQMRNAITYVIRSRSWRK